MSEAVLPESLGSLLRDLERRLAIQEATSRLALSSLREGTLSIQDADGRTLATFGKQPSGDYGIAVYDVTGQALSFAATGVGLLAPELPGVTVDATNPKAVTAVTSAEQFRIVLPQVVSPGVEVMIPWRCDAGTTGAVQLTSNVATLSDEFALTAAADGNMFVRWLHGAALTAGPLVVQLMARRTSGAGNVYISPPVGWSRDPSSCTAAGARIDG